jgi:hypothetical protein
MSDIFISYSRQDKERVAALASALQVRGWSVWWDIEILTGGEPAIDGQVAAAFEQLDSGLADIEGKDGLGQAQSLSYRISIEATTEGGGRSIVDVDVVPSNRRDRPFEILAWHARY